MPRLAGGHAVRCAATTTSPATSPAPVAAAALFTGAAFRIILHFILSASL